MVSIIDINPEVETLFQQRSLNQQIVDLVNFTIGNKKLTIEEIELTRTLTTGQKAFLANITLPAPLNNSTEKAFEWNIITQVGAVGGTNNHLNQGLVINLLGDFVGSRSTDGIFVNNTVAGTGSSLQGGTSNKSVYGLTTGTTIGVNLGIQGEARNGNVNSGLWGKAATTKAGAMNIGVFGVADNDTSTGSLRSALVGYLGSVSFPVIPFNSVLFLSMNAGRPADRYMSIARRVTSPSTQFQEFFAVHGNERIAKGVTTPDYELDWEVSGASSTAWRLRRSTDSKGFALGATSTGALIEFFNTLIIQNSNTYTGIGSNSGTNILGINSNNEVNIVANRKVTFGAATATSLGSSGRFNFLTGSTGAMESYVFVRPSLSIAYQGGILLGNQDTNASGNSSYKFSSAFSGTLNALLKISLVENSATETDLNRIFLNRGTNGRDMIFGSESNVGNISFWGDNSAHWGGGRGTLFFKFVTTIPSSDPVGGNLLYNDNGKMKYRDPNGFIVTW